MQPFKIVFASWLLIAATFANQEEFLSSRVVGGEKAPWNKFKFQVSIQQKDLDGNLKHVCGGSIVHKRWILTAAHCVYHEKRNYTIFVKSGITLLNSKGGQLAEVSKVFVNPQYISLPGWKYQYDIALLKLKEPLVLNRRVQAVKLPALNDKFVGNATFSGWGFIDPHGIEPNTLQKIVLPLVDISSCDKYYSEHLYEPYNICTGPLEPGKTPCHGDDGGPLVIYLSNGTAIQIGIYNLGHTPCGTETAASIYINVAYYVDWISSTMWEDQMNSRKNIN